MPYNTNSELPKGVRNVLPSHGQDIFREAYNNAYEQYKDPDDRRDDAGREETAQRVAWAAVKQKYEKGADDNWHPID